VISLAITETLSEMLPPALGGRVGVFDGLRNHILRSAKPQAVTEIRFSYPSPIIASSRESIALHAFAR